MEQQEFEPTAAEIEVRARLRCLQMALLAHTPLPPVTEQFAQAYADCLETQEAEGKPFSS